MQKTNNLQEIFLTQVRRDRRPVTIFLMNGFQMRGYVTGFDAFTVVLSSDGKQMVIYKHAISTIVPERAVELEGSGEAAETRRQQADQLVTALEGRDELALLEASMLLEKVPKEELPRLLDQVTAVLGNRLPQSEDPRRLLRAEALVRTLRGAAELNANPGQLSGWLCAGMFIKH